jgi:hypothetical protein
MDPIPNSVYDSLTNISLVTTEIHRKIYDIRVRFPPDEVTITADSCMYMLKCISDICPKCGCQMIFENIYKKCYYQFAITKIDKIFSYSPDNIMICCYYCIKSDTKKKKDCEYKCHVNGKATSISYTVSKRILYMRMSVARNKNARILREYPEQNVGLTAAVVGDYAELIKNSDLICPICENGILIRDFDKSCPFQFWFTSKNSQLISTKDNIVLCCKGCASIHSQKVQICVKKCHALEKSDLKIILDWVHQ